jgi:CheY-like chemotaxis protein
MQFDCSSIYVGQEFWLQPPYEMVWISDLVSRYHPKVIVSDLSMPQMDGYDLLEHVRELAPEDAAPVIALTAHSDGEERQKALKAGFARFLTKLVDPEQLVHEICNVLEPD